MLTTHNPVNTGYSVVRHSTEINRRQGSVEMMMRNTEEFEMTENATMPGGMPDTLAELMTNERKKRKLSLRACAEMIGISHTELSRIERGIRACPSLVTLQMIASAYDFDINNLTRYAANVARPIFAKPNTDVATSTQN